MKNKKSFPLLSLHCSAFRPPNCPIPTQLLPIEPKPKGGEEEEAEQRVQQREQVWETGRGICEQFKQTEAHCGWQGEAFKQGEELKKLN